MERRERKAERTKSLLPVFPVRTDNGGNGIFVNAWLRSKDSTVTGLFFITVSNRSLNVERDLRIRNKGRKKERVGMPACCTENAGNTKEYDVIVHPDVTVISTIPDERAGKSTCTWDLAKVQ